MMRAHPEWTVLNRGVNGERSDEIRARFARDVLEARPDYAIILAGVNDIYQGLPPEAVERNLGPMYAESIDAGIVPVAATVLPYNVATERDNLAMRELNHWVESLSRILSIPFCDTRAAVADVRNPDRLRGSTDGLHPDVDGCRRMGEALARTIEQDQLRRGSRVREPQ